jgi:hypothetical protein
MVVLDVAESYEAGMSAARREGFVSDDVRRRYLIAYLRRELEHGRLNAYAASYVEGVLDGLAPYGLYA